MYTYTRIRLCIKSSTDMVYIINGVVVPASAWELRSPAHTPVHYSLVIGTRGPSDIPA